MRIKVLSFICLVLLASCKNGSSSSSSQSEEWPDHLQFSHNSGFYDEPFLLSIKAPKGYEIYFTTDNSDPSEESTKYTKPIEIVDASSKPNYYSTKTGISSLDVYYPNDLVDKCQVIKVVGIDPVSKEKTPTSYLNYFVGFSKRNGYANMPVITLNMKEEDLFDYVKGIYVTGKIYDDNPHEGYPETYPANYHQKGKEWERKAHFQFFEGDKEFSFEQNIGIRIHGGWSRAFNQKSFNLYARKDYDEASTFKKPFFSNINAHSLMLRSGGYRDTFVTKIRDSLSQDFSVNEGFDVQRSFPTIVFLNGEYWGIYNLQERFSDNYVEEYHGIKKKNVLIIKNDEIDEGNQSDYHYYEEFKSFFSSNSFDDNEKYQLAQTYIDVNEFASYMSTQLYVGNIDWPGNNVRVYRDISNDNSKWHFMIYDTDDSMNMVSHMCSANIDPFIKSSHWKSGPLESDCLLGLILSKLLENADFKTLFRNTFLRIGGQNFSPDRIKVYLDNKIALLKTPMVKNYQRFVNEEYDENYFINSVNVIQSFFDERYDYAVSFLNNHIPE